MRALPRPERRRRAMLYHLLFPLTDHVRGLNLFRYLTFRFGGALVTALIVSFVLGPRIIAWLKRKQREGQPIRIDGPESHLLTKKGTPTMGGVLILLALTSATLLWADLTNPFVWVALIVTIGYGGIGFCDDYLKLTPRSSGGLPGRLKLLGQAIIGLIAAFIIMRFTEPRLATSLAVPVMKNVLIPLGALFPLWGALVMMGSSNAVNLTDGLDGLAIVPVMITAVCFALISYLAGNSIFAGYLGIPYVPGTGELAVFCGRIVRAAPGFPSFHAPPAMVFMGDTGSLSTGGAIAAVAVAAKHELVLLIVGGLFVLEAVSVIVQVASFKLTGRRVFRMAPLHHHFEKLGWKEPTIVIRFWIIAMILALAGLSTLKLR